MDKIYIVWAICGDDNSPMPLAFYSNLSDAMDALYAFENQIEDYGGIRNGPFAEVLVAKDLVVTQTLVTDIFKNKVGQMEAEKED